MRHVDPPDPPRGWQTNVLGDGRRWLNASPDHRDAERPWPFWRRYRDETGEKFNFLCCYTATYVANGTVDHFVPWSQLRGTRRAHLAYQWSNIRYADGWINASKNDEPLPDPFEVQDDWFELHLPSLELRETGKHPPELQEAIDNLMKRVRDDERVMKPRRRYLKQYQEGIRSLELIDRDMPLLGRALRANPSFLLPADRARVQAGTVG